MAINETNDLNNAMRQALSGAGLAPKATETETATQATAPQVEQPQAAHQTQYTAQPQANQQQSGFAPQGLQQNVDGTFSWMNIGALSNRPVAVSPLGEVLRNMHKALTEYWEKSLEDDLLLNIIPVDRHNVPNLAVSLLIVTMKATNDPTAPVAHHTLLLAGSVEDFESQRETIQGHTIDVITLTSDAYDSVMRGIVQRVVKQANPDVPEDKILDADAETIARNFDYTSDELLHNLTLNSVLACRTALDTTNPNFKDINLVRASNDSNLNLYVKYHQGHEKDATGLPVRSDVTVDLRASLANQQQRFGAGHQTVARATGYIDLLWRQNPIQNNPYLQAQQMLNPMAAQIGQSLNQTYQANFVLTSLSPVSLQTIPALLVTLLSASYVCDNNNWIGALRPAYDGTGRPPLHDIGAIGYDVQPTGTPAPIQTTPDVFNISSLASLVAAYFHPGVVMSLDVPEVGSQSWELSVFARAANGNAVALGYLRWAANQLTNNLFDKYYQELQGSGQYVSTNYNVILNGYYVDDKGQQRDIRDIDYLVVAAELGSKDPALLADYTNSFADSRFDPTLRMDARKRLIEGLRPSVVWTGKSLRVDFESKFIQALSRAAQECRFFLNAQFPDNSAAISERATAGYVNGAVLTSYNSGIFRSGYANVAQHGNTLSGYTGRWGGR